MGIGEILDGCRVVRKDDCATEGVNVGLMTWFVVGPGVLPAECNGIGVLNRWGVETLLGVCSMALFRVSKTYSGFTEGRDRILSPIS